MTRSDRAQSNVVGVALLLGIAVVSMSVLTASVGVIVERNAASADATRIADEMDAAFEPVETTGIYRGRLSFSSGTLQPADRQVRVLDGTSIVRKIDAGALVFTTSNQRVAFVGGAIVRGRPGNAWLYDTPPITTSHEPGGVLIVGVPRIGAVDSVSGRGGVALTVTTNVTHRRESLGNGTYSIAVETETPRPFTAYFRDAGATVERRDIDGDGIESVVATFDGVRTTYLVVHDLDAEVGRG